MLSNDEWPIKGLQLVQTRDEELVKYIEHLKREDAWAGYGKDVALVVGGGAGLSLVLPAVVGLVGIAIAPPVALFLCVGAVSFFLERTVKQAELEGKAQDRLADAGVIAPSQKESPNALFLKNLCKL